jgi:hypothetical protein
VLLADVIVYDNNNMVGVESVIIEERFSSTKDLPRGSFSIGTINLCRLLSLPPTQLLCILLGCIIKDDRVKMMELLCRSERLNQ